MKSFHDLNKFRITEGPMASSPDNNNGGAFRIIVNRVRILYVIAAHEPEIDWEHASVHASLISDDKEMETAMPTWFEMDFIKGLFWEDEDLVYQFHMPKSFRNDEHKNVLHLWRSKSQQLVLPPKGHF